ncbi:hypothetical protein D9M71_515850 [compost metagenome]
MAVYIAKPHGRPVGKEQKICDVVIRRAAHHRQYNCHVQPGERHDAKEPANQKINDAVVIEQKTCYQETRQGKKYSHAHDTCSGIQLQDLWAEW